VFFVEVETAQSIKIQKPVRTDDQMRLRMEQLSDQRRIELHGISAFGTRMCFYCLAKNSESVTPPPVPWDFAYVKDVAPADRWDMDILTPDGYNRFVNIVEHVRDRAAIEGVAFLLVLITITLTRTTYPAHKA
jgi:hypothetical protein